MDQLRNILAFEWLVIGEYRLQVADLLWLLLVWVSLWGVMRLVKGLLKRKTWLGRIEPNDEQRKAFRRLARFLLYPLAIVLSLGILGVNISSLLFYELYHPDEARGIKTIHILGIIATIIAARGLLWYVNRWFVKSNKAQNLVVDQGRRLAIFQIIKYAVVLLVLLFCLTLLQVNLSVFWVGTTGLLLVVGLALQQTFNDFFSGLLILLDGTIEVGDMIFVDSLRLTGEVKEIRLRTTIVETLDSTNVIVPNSSITSSNVVNWTYNDKETRFRLNVGVSYDSNVQLVRKVLRSCAISHGLVLPRPNSANSPAPVRNPVKIA
ncbi:MAG: mechanosensitive ion channel domain-containing protein, partial [Bacteroidota bacterium]